MFDQETSLLKLKLVKEVLINVLVNWELTILLLIFQTLTELAIVLTIQY